MLHPGSAAIIEAEADAWLVGRTQYTEAATADRRIEGYLICELKRRYQDG